MVHVSKMINDPIKGGEKEPLVYSKKVLWPQPLACSQTIRRELSIPHRSTVQSCPESRLDQRFQKVQSNQLMDLIHSTDCSPGRAVAAGPIEHGSLKIKTKQTGGGGATVCLRDQWTPGGRPVVERRHENQDDHRSRICSMNERGRGGSPPVS